MSDILGIHISNSVLRPQYKIPWEEWGVIQHFFLPLALEISFGSQLREVEKHPFSYNWLVPDPGEPSQPLQGVRLGCLSGTHPLYQGGR